ncbi:SHOCT domain-containing protein [Natronorubrum sulfidifaciens]|uniref:SHOCT domain-containing protein n=1 Tax=Natronorubrum sulfidifaciens JCM 14089 TaxID=1230460 RepID=L9WCS3_9EURY|nr:SHOCT domain-containing protein [Natronorubrum sulfidifaciens]ELY47269.1 hypothetical protein C495_03387 [Natronorubrum sulfidifaciens JCM 14089]
MGTEPGRQLRENITGVTAMIVTGVWLSLMFSPWGGQLWLPLMLIGYLVVVPLVALLFGDEQARAEWWDGTWVEAADTSAEQSTDRTADSTRPSRGRQDALETLRDRYAAGEVTDEQFEHKLERLLETETLEDATERARDRHHGSAATPNRDRDQNRDVEYES